MQTFLIKILTDKTMEICGDGLFQKEAKVPRFHKK